MSVSSPRPVSSKNAIPLDFKKDRATPENEPYHLMLKLIILGDSGVGKTNIISSFCDDNQHDKRRFQQKHIPTIGVDFRVKKIMVDNRLIKLQIWDTAGQERYKNITETYYKGAAGILVAYSVDSNESFLNAEKWIEQVCSRTSSQIQKILIANKIDILEESGSARQVSEREGLDLARKYGLGYVEVSALKSIGVSQLFYNLTQSLKSKIEEEMEGEKQEGQKSHTISLDYRKEVRLIKFNKNGIEYTKSLPVVVNIPDRKRCQC